MEMRDESRSQGRSSKLSAIGIGKAGEGVVPTLKLKGNRTIAVARDVPYDTTVRILPMNSQAFFILPSR